MKKTQSKMSNLLTSRLSSERENLRDFLEQIMEDDLASDNRIKLPPGTGKSYATAELPSLYPNKKFIYIIPNHDLAFTISDHLDIFGTDYEHVIGKTKAIKDDFGRVIREKPCWRTSGDEYYPGCSTCPYNEMKECDWHQQFIRANSSQVVITTFHHVSRCGEDRVVIYDESPETQIMNTHILPTHFFPSISLGSKFKKKAGSTSYTFYESVELDEDFEVESLDCYKLQMFFMSNINIKCCMNNGKFLLFGRTKTFLPESYDKLIFTCATTDDAVASSIFNIPMPLPNVPDLFWETYEPVKFKTNVIKNYILKIYGGRSKKGTGGWSKNYSTNSLTDVFKMFSGWFSANDILVITKKSFKERIKKYLPHADIVHYGKGRGINDYNRKFDLILVYGRYGMTPLNFEMMKQLGFNKQTVKEMEISEMLQCLHRGRPITHPKTPIMVMSDSHLLEGKDTVSLRAMSDYHNHYDLNTEQSLNKITTVLHGSSHSRNLLRAKSYLIVRKFMDYVNFED